MDALKRLIKNQSRKEIEEFRSSLQATLERKLVDFEILPQDEFSTCVLPEDTPLPRDYLVALRTTGNGNCLFNAISLTMTGDGVIFIQSFAC